MSLAGMLAHQVEILYDFEGGGNATVCLGSIISSYLVLTVATCLAGRNESLFKIRANGKNQKDQIRTIDEVYSYAALDSDDSPFDVTAIRLDSKLELDKRYASKIRYAEDQIPALEDFAGEDPLCHEPGLSELRTVWPSECSDSLEEEEGKNFLCVESSEDAGNETFKAPLPLSGSSLICSGFLYGVFAMNWTSDGENGGKRVYTSVAAYSHWIRFVFDDGTDSGADGKSSGGTVVDQIKNPVPYQLSIQYNGRHHCGGVILDKKTALSAAHCFTSKTYNHYTVVAGETNLNQNDTTEQIYQIDTLLKHPRYTEVLKGNDIAVIHVKGEFNFTDRVNNVWISSPTRINYQNFNGTATGWGKTGTYSALSPVLQLIDLVLLDRKECKKKWSFLKPSMLCGSSETASVCGGDSGGPFVIKNYDHGEDTLNDVLVGITSFGPKNCEERDKPNGFTNVALYYDWISKVRSNSLCSSAQFQCFNGECIEQELKCDQNIDCEDGSDERMCESDSRITTFCGGLITLDREHEIIYKVPKKERQRDSICLWIISTGRKDVNASIEATILYDSSAQFNPRSDIIFASHSFAINSSQILALNQMRAKYRIPGPFMALYYRTNSSARNAGFHMKLKDSVLQSNIRQRLQARLVPLPNANLKRGKMREFSYPSSSSSYSRALKYASNQRTFFILKPTKSGAKMRLNLTFVDTEEEHDWLQISTYREHPIFLTRFSGHGNWTEHAFNALENEPIFFYFHSDEKGEGEGFKIKYSEVPALKPFPCGGFIRLEEEYELSYQAPKNLRGEKFVCVWVVAAKNGSTIETELLNNPLAQFQPQDSSLFALYDFKVEGSSYMKMATTHFAYIINEPFIVLYFRTNTSVPNSGFHVRLTEEGQRNVTETVKSLELEPKDYKTSTIQEFKYPESPATYYTENERTFIIVKPQTIHGKLKLDLTSVDTEEDYDWLEILTVKSRPTSEFLFHGEDSWSDKSFEAEQDEPFILYFHSDEATSATGFQVSYSEQKDPQSLTTTCGGFINLKREHEIIYKVPSEVDQLQGQRDSNCLWIVSTGRKDSGASIEATILDNPSAQFNSTSDVIFATYNFTTEKSWSKLVNQIGEKYNIFGPFMTLYYRSNSSAPNAGLHLKLRDSIFESDIMERLDVKLVPVPNADLNEGEIQEFLYLISEPGADVEALNGNETGALNSTSSSNSTSKFSSIEHTFFILKPQKPGAKIRVVNLTLVDPGKNNKSNSWLEIGTHRVNPTNLLRVSDQSNWSWTERIIEGLEDEPLYFYFHSNKLREGQGFKIQYSEIMAPKSSPCGGSILLKGEEEIVYKVPEKLRGEKSVCVWVIAAAGGSRVKTEVLSNPKALFQPGESTLFTLYDFPKETTTHTNMLSKDTTMTINQPFLVLYFRTNSSAPNSGFHIRLQEAGRKQRQKAVKYLELPPPTTEGATQEFQYPPPPAEEYANNERTFIILKPTTRHGKLKLDLKSVDTEEQEDWMEILSVKSEPTPGLRFSGEDEWSDNRFEAEEDEPFIIYFHSDKVTAGSGFHISYSEQRSSGRKAT